MAWGKPVYSSHDPLEKYFLQDPIIHIIHTGKSNDRFQGAICCNTLLRQCFGVHQNEDCLRFLSQAVFGSQREGHHRAPCHESSASFMSPLPASLSSPEEALLPLPGWMTQGWLPPLAFEKCPLPASRSLGNTRGGLLRQRTYCFSQDRQCGLQGIASHTSLCPSGL